MTLTDDDRRDLAANLREILATFPDRAYARAFSRCVLWNYRGYGTIIPKHHDGRWYPRKQRKPL